MMGIVDIFNPEDRVEVTKGELFDFMKNKAKTELLINGLKNGVSAKDVLKVVDMKKVESEERDNGRNR